MKTKTIFKTVAYMRQVRNELSTLFQEDKKRFQEELKHSMADFISRRQKADR